MVAGNTNIMMARLDPVRYAQVQRLRKKDETDSELIRRAFDVLAEKEGV